MSNIFNGQGVQDIVIAVSVLGGSFLYFRNRLPRQTIKDLQEHVKAQDLIIQDLRNNREKDLKVLSDLQGQIKVYKELPLRELADGMKTIAKSNQDILFTLKNSALIAADDREVSINQTKKIEVNKK